MKRTWLLFVFIPVCLLLPLIGVTAGTAPGDLRFDREDKSEIESFPPSIFPHWIHRVNYRCDACHDSLFAMKLGATPITMDLMAEGKVCGSCHNGEAAFASSFQTCSRCHLAAEE
jgi:c(7)-type cytochrome triheme protein